MLFVRREVHHQIGVGNHLLEAAHRESILSGVLPGLTLFGDGFGTESVRHVQPAVTQIEPLVQALGTASENYDSGA